MPRAFARPTARAIGSTAGWRQPARYAYSEGDQIAEVVEFAPGTPSWVDLGSTDLAATRAFYCDLLDWEADNDTLAGAGGYTLFRSQGRRVAGMGPMPGDGQPAWTTFFTVADADAAVLRAVALGGEVVQDPVDIVSMGRAATIVDGVGAVLALWEPKGFSGAELTGEPGSICWAELACRDGEGARRFYAEVLNWEATCFPFAGSTYTQFSVAGDPVSGMVEMNQSWPPEVPAHWLVYFAVDDPDRVAAQAQELGGSVSVEPTEIPPGRFSVIADPQGAVFAVIALAVTG